MWVVPSCVWALRSRLLIWRSRPCMSPSARRPARIAARVPQRLRRRRESLQQLSTLLPILLLRPQFRRQRFHHRPERRLVLALRSSAAGQRQCTHRAEQSPTIQHVPVPFVGRPCRAQAAWCAGPASHSFATPALRPLLQPPRPQREAPPTRTRLRLKDRRSLRKLISKFNECI